MAGGKLLPLEATGSTFKLSRIDSFLQKRFTLSVKSSLLAVVGTVGTLLVTSCTTLENRADLYSPANYFANGPYTRMLRRGIPTVKTELVTVSTSRSDILYQRGK
jgi:hypothetical protein